VSEGEQVAAGDVLFRLVKHEQTEANLAAAELELLLARQALDDLYKYAGLELAQTRKSLAEAERVLVFAEDKVGSLKAPTSQADIEQARVNLLLAENRLEKAKEDYQRIERKFNNKKSIMWQFMNRKQFRTLLENLQLAEIYAQKRYDASVEKLDDLQAPADEVDLLLAEAELAVARADVEDLQRELSELQNGPRADDVSLAESRVRAAEAAQDAARRAIKNRELVAPRAGRVVDLKIKEGEWVEAGQPVILLADFSQWVVETDDLTETEVINVTTGQQVQIIPDALPDLALHGRVERIRLLAEEKRGDVTYTARILVNDVDPRLRWGMTVTVTFTP